MTTIVLVTHRLLSRLRFAVISNSVLVDGHLATLLIMTVCWSTDGAAIQAAEPPVQNSSMAFKTDEVGFQKHLSGFLAEHCVRCHGAEKAEGEFRVDRDLSAQFDQLTTKSKWGEVVNVLNSHEMPPEDEPQPAPESVALFVDWITQQMVKAELLHREATVVMRRLNRDEYHNTILDLTGVDFDTSHFPKIHRLADLITTAVRFRYRRCCLNCTTTPQPRFLIELS